ncbi:MAG: nicotinate phosphoribosyltransferase [Candidatus Lokiarchaeota archaeon]|nr:nicotinate phosphoribosyltransferase [Candidatus Lokiarchaeota archaeon]
MEPNSCFINEDNMFLSTDFYQISMCAAYYQYNLENGIAEEDDISTFELFVRKLPDNRNFMIFAGLEQVIHYIQNARVTPRVIEYLKGRQMLKNINESFFEDYLPNFKFNLDVWSMPEGTVFFPNEPLVRVTGPTFHAQLLETYILSVVNYQIIVASKAARIRKAAQDKLVLEFGTRRAHSPQAGIYAARASYIGGFDGTSNVVSDLELGIEASGTMAHSFIEKFGEMESFEIFYKYYGENTINLIDTYDIAEGTLKSTKFGNNILGVRIDSGDLTKETKRVRKILDDNGCDEVQIVLSSNLDEYKIKEILDKGAPADAFGVGTELVTSSDDPKLSAVYKLMEHNGEPKIKISEGKKTYPGRKQLYRRFDQNGKFKEDLLMLEDEEPPENAYPLLVPIMKNGKLIYDLPSLDEIKKYCRENIEKLPEKYRQLKQIKVQKVHISEKLDSLMDRLISKYE